MIFFNDIIFNSDIKHQLSEGKFNGKFENENIHLILKKHNSLLLEVIDLNKWSTVPRSEIDSELWMPAFSKLNHALNEFTLGDSKLLK